MCIATLTITALLLLRLLGFQFGSSSFGVSSLRSDIRFGGSSCPILDASCKQAIGVDKAYNARCFLGVACSANRCRILVVIVYIFLLLRADALVADPRLISLDVHATLISIQRTCETY